MRPPRYLAVLLLAIGFPLLQSGCVLVKIADGEKLNPVRHKEATGVSESTKQFHRTLMVADLHADTLMLDRGGKRGIQKRHDYGHADVPRWREGNVGFQMLTVATITPKPYSQKLNGGWILPNAQWVLASFQGWPPRTWTNAREHGLHQAKKWRVNGDGKALVPIRTRGDLQRFMAQYYQQTSLGWVPLDPQNQPVASVLGLEGCHALQLKDADTDEQIAARVKEFRDAGFRVLAPTHHFDNEIGGGSEGSEQGGLTPLGHRLFREMERQQMICDLSHASNKTINDVLKYHPRIPVLISHTGVAFHPLVGKQEEARLNTRRQVRQIAQRGGIIGIGLWPEAVGDAEPEYAASIIRQCIDDPAIGPKHVVLGSDMDGSVEAAFAANNWCMITEELRILPESTLRDVMGGNIIRFFLKHLPEE
ncbi:membrane dipeptidase [Roseimicrobium sp. ORNL1]|uniref:dipeptidase n=1 Tax=Roseimicrobium sp. ORNL1 TaxID=2711231 RepID=UPI0013E150A0|nr:membrane dipeptidase [Roseimicrobium sp. ORNL1]QIF03346.1 amidohydrolase family protein [Roseimicrobium sp. ORNL1]